MKLWAGRFSKSTNGLVDAYNASINFDQILVNFDIQGSLAHVAMLAKCNLIASDEALAITDGLQVLLKKAKQNSLDYRLSDEDIHMNIERMLHEEIGAVAGKLHTGRSRNDQVALDIHLYLRNHCIAMIEKLHQLLTVLHELAKEHIDTIIPGYTHLQRAEPIRLGHHFMAYFNMFARDADRLCDNFKRINVCPLGAGALAGSGVAVDREFVAELLNFEGVYENSLDAVSDRDFAVEFLANAALTMMHFSKLSEELILWSSQEFSFIQFDDAFCTGSSMMPQKKNPDVCELARGKTGRVYGALMGLLTVLKGLPLAYNKDMQEDKEGLFDTVDTLSLTLDVYTPMLASMTVNKENMREAVENDFSNATNLANYLVAKGITFRVAHKITGKIVLHCIDKKCLLQDLNLDEFKFFEAAFEQDIYQAIDAINVIEEHSSRGGTAKTCVIKQCELASDVLVAIKKWIDEHEYMVRIDNA